MFVLNTRVKSQVLATVTGRAEAARDRCGPGREFLQCGSSCPPKCTDAQQQRPQPCLANCVAGCFCRNGLVEDPNGQCVPPERCPPPKCGKNEIYQTCGTACQPRCGQKAADACVASCEIGCFCAPGYIRHPKKNNCISVAQCGEYHLQPIEDQ